MINFRNIGYALVISISILYSCKDKKTLCCVTPDENIVIPFGTSDTVVFYLGIDGVAIPAVISIPDCGPVEQPAVVVMHGSDGNWRDEDTDGDGIEDVIVEYELSWQNKDWKRLLDDNCMVSIFPGSYYPRGTVENQGDWKTWPKQAKISAQFIRPYDAYGALDLLRRLVYENGQSVIKPNKVAILGFSHGASAVLGSIYNTSSAPSDWRWSQKFDGVEYFEEDGVKPPPEIPVDGGFTAGVYYYGGAVGNGYWGYPCEVPKSQSYSIYQNYCSLLMHLAELDPLTENSECLVEVLATQNTGLTVFRYPQSNHGFDGKDEGIDMESSLLARERTINWLNAHLK